MSHSVILIYSTFPDIPTAENTINHLLEKKLIACANLIPGGTSFYLWNNAIEKSSECYVLFKTLIKHKESCIKMIQELHPYSTPAILCWQPSDVNKVYQNWILQEI